MKIHLDFETRSLLDLPKVGAHLYAAHPSTDVVCMAYRFDEGPVFLWKYGEPCPRTLATAIKSGATVVAHNANFEHLIWNLCCVVKYGWPPLLLEQMDCTMIRAYSMGLPGTLENAAKAVGLKAEKDMKGHRIMLQLCRPRNGPLDTCVQCRGTGMIDYIGVGPHDIEEEITFCKCVEWWEPKDSTPKLNIKAKYEHLYRYCIQDVIVECELDKRILPISESEKRLWIIDQKINSRGIYCDIKTAKRALELIQIEQKRLNKEMQKITLGDVSTCNAAVALAKWINSHDIYQGAKDDIGELLKCESVAKPELLEMLNLHNLPPIVRKALLTRQEAAKSSTAKLKRMVEGVGPDSRIRGCFQFYGAASTGRFAGRRIQLQNMPRPTIEQWEIEQIIKILQSDKPIEQVIKEINFFHGAPIPRMSDCLRAMLCAAPGKKLISVDFSQIESRMLAWLAGEEKKLAIFRGHGLFYEFAASNIFKIQICDVTKDQRQLGKYSELAFGFQGGLGAYRKITKSVRVKATDAEVETRKLTWRATNPFIVKYWYALDEAAIAATENPGQKFAVGPRERRVIFLRPKGSSFLFCCLPSGRAICYPYPKIKVKFMIKDPKTKAWRKFNPKTDAKIKDLAIEKTGLVYKGDELYKFVEKSAYGGLLCENITQATSRDLFVERFDQFEKSNYPIVLHNHDEVLAEVDKNFGSLKEVQQIICQLPVWAKDLPIAAEGWIGQRYRK